MKKISILILILILTNFQNETEAYSTNPKQFIVEIVEEAKKILVTGNDKNFREKKLSQIAIQTVDIDGIGNYSLGKYRKNLTESELKEYKALFKNYFLKSFTSRLSDYSDPKIEVVSAEVKNPKYTIVRSILLSTDKKPEVKIDWRVYTKNPEEPLIRDLIIEGISLARTQKEEFASVIENNNGDIKKLFVTLIEFANK